MYLNADFDIECHGNRRNFKGFEPHLVILNKLLEVL